MHNRIHTRFSVHVNSYADTYVHSLPHAIRDTDMNMGIALVGRSWLSYPVSPRCILSLCFVGISAAEPVQSDPCNPSPCGPNAQCRDGGCTCLPEYQGDPYSGCRPECVLSTDCSRDRACIRNKCADPCPGTCGQGATCDVVNHIPICSCPQGTSGNPFVQCRPVPRK